jgi:endonuclease/exonuclease/phosphatase family metal-dependent hydrolase
MSNKTKHNKTRNKKIRNNKTRNKKTKNNKIRNKKYKQKGGTFPEIQALTYNLSWASQKKVVAGSEADFVEQCISIKRDCYAEALKKITELHKTFKFDIIGIQEVEDANLVTTICKNTGLSGWYRGATWNSIANIYSGCAIIWNTNTLGTMETSKTINLAHVDKNNKFKCDARTCCIVTTSKDVNLIVAHFPWLNTREDIFAITEIIDAHISSHGPIIILADTNDSKTLISNEFPLIIKNKALSHGLSKKEAREVLNSCCWHKKKEKVEDYDHLTDTGDYILSENVRNIRIPISHPTNEPSETELYSDHMPVIASIII